MAERADGGGPRRASLGDLIAEARRRRVFRVMVGYGLFAFAVLQVAEPLLHGLHLPDWMLTAAIVALAVGFPVALALAWLFDLTARGVTRTAPVSGTGGPSFSRGRLAAILVAAAVVGALPGLGWILWRDRAPRTSGGGAPVQPSIAVLPFSDMSPAKDQEYFADGIAEEILNKLARVPRLKVIGRTSSFSFRGSREDLRSIGQKLGAANLLEGSVRRAGNRVHITSRLVEASGGTQVWSQSFERELVDVFAVQEEIAGAVATALQTSLAPTRGARPVDPEAYDRVLRGRRLLDGQTAEAIRAARESFERAIAIDPGYAPAHAGLARAWGDAAGYSAATPDEVTADSRRELEAAERAIALDPDLPDGYVIRARYRSDYLWDWTGARADLERARTLKPADLDAIVQGSCLLAALGRMPEAVGEARRAADVDPLSPGAWTNLATLLLATRDLAGAEAAARRGLQASPGNPLATYVLAQALVEGGRSADAIPLFEGLRIPYWRLTGLAVALHRTGKARESQAALDQLVGEHAQFAGYQIAQVHANRGDPDAAFEWLQRARLQHDRGLAVVPWDPWLAKLHADPRWKPFLRSLNLPVE